MNPSALLVLLSFLALLLPLSQNLVHWFPEQPLVGVQKTAPSPVWSGRDWFEKEFQARGEARFNQRYGLHDAFVKTHNQLFFSVFGESSSKEGIVMGREGTLLNDGYNRLALQMAPPHDWRVAAAQLKRLHRLARKHGVAFLVFLTPSKASLHPEYIPEDYFRFPHGKPGTDATLFARELRAAGVPLVDAREILRRKLEAGEGPFFPRGGIHWDEQGVFLASQALLQGIERETGRSIARLRAVSVGSGPAQGSDRDYLDLTNLWVSPRVPETPRVEVAVQRGEACGRLAGVFAGGSFLERPFSLFISKDIFVKYVLVFYGNRFLKLPDREPGLRDARGLDWRKDVLAADFIVLEINEGTLKSAHLDKIAGVFPASLSARWSSGRLPPDDPSLKRASP